MSALGSFAALLWAMSLVHILTRLASICLPFSQSFLEDFISTRLCTRAIPTIQLSFLMELERFFHVFACAHLVLVFWVRNPRCRPVSLSQAGHKLFIFFFLPQYPEFACVSCTLTSCKTISGCEEGQAETVCLTKAEACLDRANSAAWAFPSLLPQPLTLTLPSSCT